MQLYPIQLSQDPGDQSKSISYMEKNDYVLLIENSVEDVILFEHCLEEQQFEGEIMVLSQGTEAISYLKQNPTNHPAMIMMDMFLEDMDGAELMEELNTVEGLSHIPVILTSGMDPCNLQRLSEELGASSYLVKPMGLDALHEYTREFIGLWNQYLS